MPNLTLSISGETKKKMDSHSNVRWSNVVRTIIEEKLEDFEEAERIAKKSKLTMKDFKPIEAKINAAARKHTRKLLNENNS